MQTCGAPPHGAISSEVRMSKLILPHGSSELTPLLLEGSPREEESKKAKGLKKGAHDHSGDE